MGVRGVTGVCGGTALVTQLDTVTRPLDKSEKEMDDYLTVNQLQSTRQE